MLAGLLIVDYNAVKSRLVTLQLWRSVSAEPLARMPLMVCDRTSIDPADLVYTPNPNAP